MVSKLLSEFVLATDKHTPYRSDARLGVRYFPVAPHWRSLMWSAQAQAEGLTLLVAENKTGYLGVHLNQTSKSKPFVAQVSRSGKLMHLGTFATAEEAALCFARSPGVGQAAAKRAAAAAPPARPLTSEEARQQAQAEGLTLLVARNKTGYFGVVLSHPGYPKPYKA